MSPTRLLCVHGIPSVYPCNLCEKQTVSAETGMHFVYKGYWGSAEISILDEICYGRILLIGDVITYESESVRGLREAFEEAVDDYIQRVAELRAQRPTPPTEEPTK